jgi:GNAT superfamily N-acetyltransferase
MIPDNAENTSSVALADGFHDNDRPEIARMYWAAFGTKLGFALSPPARAIELLTDVINPGSAIVARGRNDELLGVAGYKTPSAAFLSLDYEGLKRHFGALGAVWRGTVLSFLDRRPEAGTLLMDGIFVAERARGQGVGALLLNAIKTKAREQGCAQVRLDVIDTNPRARKLYEREGFQAASVRDLGLLRFLFGFRRVTTMLSAAAPRS